MRLDAREFMAIQISHLRIFWDGLWCLAWSSGPAKVRVARACVVWRQHYGRPNGPRRLLRWGIQVVDAWDRAHPNEGSERSEHARGSVR